MPTPLPIRFVLTGLAVVLAVSLQGTLLARLPLPGSAPNLILVLVVAIALAAGAGAGMAVGFAAGLLADLLSAHPAGVLALCFGLVGFLVGLLDTSSERSMFWPLVVTGVAAAISYLSYAGIMTVLSDHRSLDALPATVFYDVMLTPFVVPLVALVDRRFDTGRQVVRPQ